MEKKYTVKWKKGEAVSFRVDRKTYNSLGEVTDHDDLMIFMSMATNNETSRMIDPSAKPTMPVEKILFIVFSAIAVLMAAIAIISANFSTRSLASEKTVPGLVVALIDRQDYEGDTLYYPSVRFKLPDGRVETVEMNVGTNPPAYKTGNQVTIAYLPGEPENARIKTTFSDIEAYLVTLITGAICAAFLLAAGFAGWMHFQCARKSTRAGNN